MRARLLEALPRPVFLALLWSLAAASSGAAQIIQVTVRDSANRAPVSGAVITVYDASARVLGRAVTNQAGRIAVPAPAATRSIRVVRIGYRMREFRFAEGQIPASLDISMLSQPMLLDPVVTRQNSKCSRRGDREAALSLLMHARSGLLASVVSQSNEAPSMVGLLYRREMTGINDVIARQFVRIDSAPDAVTSFNAAFSASEFVDAGFVTRGPKGLTYHAPDANVLLDDEFSSGYCFQLADRDRARPNQVGVAFRAPDERSGRVDIEGTLWVDTTARRVVDIEFLYRGLDMRLDMVRSGGRVSFAELRPGVVMVNRWHLRLPVADSSPTRSPESVQIVGGMVMGASTRAAELGGELARAKWKDGTTWAASLGTLQLTAMKDSTKRAPPGVVVRLEDTDYVAVTDSNGVASFVEVLPGPYRISVIDPRLRAIDLTLPVSGGVVAERGVMIAKAFRVPTVESFVEEQCRELGRFDPRESTWLLMRVMSDSSSMPVSKVRVSTRLTSTSPDEMRDKIITGSDGIVPLCRGFLPGMGLSVLAQRDGMTHTVPIRLQSNVTIVRIRWPF